MNSACKRYLSSVAITLTLGTSLGCLPEDDFQDLEVMAPSPQVSLPLFNTNLSLSDLINTDGEGNNLVENSDQSYSLKYQTNIASPPMAEFFPEIPDQHYSEQFSLGYDAPGLYSDSITTHYQEEIPLTFDEFALYKIEPKQGNLIFNISSSYDHDMKVVITLDGVVDEQGNSLSETFDLVSWNRYSVRRDVSLAGYEINLEESKLTYRMDVTIYGGTGNAISSTQMITFDFDMLDLDFSYMEGNFANITVPVKADTLLIPVFQNAVQGNIAIQPRLNMSFRNSFGVDIKSDLSRITVSTQQEQPTRLADEGTQAFFVDNFRIAAPATREQVTAIHQKIDKTNSNIEDAFATVPDGILYDLGFMLDNSTSDTSFVSDSSAIAVDIEAEIPLEGSFDMTMADTMAVDFQEFAENIDELKVLIKTENSFPIDAYLQICFLDENGNLLTDAQGNRRSLFDHGEQDSLSAARLLHAASIVDTKTGETLPEKVDMPIVATISDQQILETARYFLIETRVRSSEQAGSIKLYAFYNIRFSMAMQMKASL